MYNAEIFVMDLDGSNPVRLTDDAGKETDPDWTPDGSQIAFISDRDGPSALYVMNADGLEAVNLSESVGHDNLPDW